MTRKACGAIVGVVFLGVSFALTGTAQLRATEAERRDIGGALNDAIASFDDAAPVVKLLNVLGPWAGVIDGIAEAAFGRAIYIAQHRVPRGTMPAAPPDYNRSAGNGRSPLPYEDDDEIHAPDPGAGSRT